jgi:pyruvate/2-oxoglutarate dehydrogenase complex dihydrolipoamide acyltransferase (E2) component
MEFEFKLPDLGEGVSEGEIVRWLVDPGDAVKVDQPVVEVMTDKVTAELPSPVAGKVLRLGGGVGDVVEVGQPLLCIETGSETPAPGPAAVSPAPGPGPNGAEAPAREPGAAARPLAVPAVRKLAKELGVDLSALEGTGPGGRIIEADVRAAAAAPEPRRAPPAPPSTVPPAREPRRIPLRGMRRVIAEHLLAAHRDTAPYTYVEEVDFTDLVGLRERVQGIGVRANVRITYLPFLLAAVSLALKEHPELNATVDAETGDLLVHPEHNIGIAVHTDHGLVVPVVRGVERRNLLDLSREVDRLAEAARMGKLTREEVQGGTFSVTSLGPLGGVMATPMLNTPEVAVLGIHKIAARPVVREGVVVPRQMGNLSLTLDHRYIDGYVGASFAQTLKRHLEDPAVMLFSLAELREVG